MSSTVAVPQNLLPFMLDTLLRMKDEQPHLFAIDSIAPSAPNAVPPSQVTPLAPKAKPASSENKRPTSSENKRPASTMEEPLGDFARLRSIYAPPARATTAAPSAAPITPQFVTLSPEDMPNQPDPLPVAAEASELRCFRCGENTHFKSRCIRFKTVLCWHAKTGTCRFAPADCNFAHGDSELRSYASETMVCESCGGDHATIMCRHSATEAKDAHTDAHIAENDDMAGIWCSYCQTDEHDNSDCTEKWCKTCNTASHWESDCTTCKWCKDRSHRSNRCPYIAHPRRQ